MILEVHLVKRVQKGKLDPMVWMEELDLLEQRENQEILGVLQAPWSSWS